MSTSTDLMTTLAWSLLHFLWQGAAIAAVAAAAMQLSRESTTRYLVGVVALVLMCVSFGVTFALLAGAPAAGVETAAQISAMSATSSEAAATTVRPGSVTLSLDRPAAAELDFAWVARLWLVGVCLLALRVACGLLLLEHLRRRSVSALPVDIVEQCLALQRRLGISRVVRYCECRLVTVPSVIGFLRPVVLLPVRALTGLSAEQLEVVIAHELGHIKRFDVAVNLFQVVVETLFFFHPAVWWLNRRIRADREDCCDDIAISACGRTASYARALAMMDDWRGAAQLSLAVTGDGVASRVARLLGMSRRPSGVRSAGVFTAALVLAAALTAGAASIGIARPALSAAGAASLSQIVARTDGPPLVELEAPLALDAQLAPVETPLAQVDVHLAQPDRQHAQVDAQLAQADVQRTQVDAQLAQGDAQRAQADGQPAQTDAQLAQVDRQHAQADAQLSQVDAQRAQADRQLGQVDGLLAQVDPNSSRAGAARGQTDAQRGTSFIDEMRTVGVDVTDVDLLIALKIHGVTADYVSGIRDAGFDVNTDEVIAMKIHDVSPEYIAGLRDSGLELDDDNVIAMKIHGITPEYIEELRDLGLGLDNDEIVAMKIHGVSPDYIEELRDLGLGLDNDDIVAMKIHGITPEYIEELRDLGLELDNDDIIAVKIHDVSPEYIVQMRGMGFELDMDDVVALKVHDVTPEFIEEARARGFTDLSVDQIIRLKNADIL